MPSMNARQRRARGAPGMPTRGGTVVLALGACLLLITACGGGGTSVAGDKPSGGGGQTQKITLVEGAHVIGYAPVYLAMKRGYFTDQGLDVTLTTAKSSSEAVAAVVGGSAIGSLTAATDALNAVKSGAKVKLAFAITTQWGLVLTASNNYLKQHSINASMPLAQKIHGLKGAKIGVSAVGSATALAVQVMLRSEGMDASKDITIVPIGSNAAAATAALENGVIDAFMFSPPFGNTAQSRNIGAPLIDLNTGEVPAFNGALFQAIVVDTNAVSSHHSEIVGMGKALQRAEQDIANDPASAAQDIVSSFPGADKTLIEAAFKTATPSFAKTPAPISTTSVQKDIDALGIGSQLTPAQTISAISLSG